MSNGITNPFDIMTGPSVPVYESGTEGAAPIPTVAAASLIQDPQARMRYYSQQMGIPMEQFGIADGRIAYSRPGTGLPPQLVEPGAARSFVKGLGPSFPAVGSALGVISTAPLGPPAMIGGGVAGATGGQTLREYIAMGMSGQRPSPGRIIGEGALDLGASLVGLGIGKGLTRAAVRDAAKQFKEAMGQAGATTASALKNTLDAVNAKYGTNIKITPAELTRNAELIAIQKTLAGDPRTGETMARFAAERGGQFGVAMSQALEEIAPGAPAREVAGAEMAEAATEASVALAMARSRAGQPMYAQAFEAGSDVNMSRTVKAFESAMKRLPVISGKLRRPLAFIADPIKNKAGEITGYRPKKGISLEFVQNNVKELMDDMIGAAERAGRRKEALQLREVQGTLLKEMDTQVPEYAAARKVWGDLSRPIDDIEGGLLPKLANLTNKDFEYMGARFLSASSPSAIKSAKNNILRLEGGQDTWNNFIRGALEQSWEKASRVRQGEIGRPDLRGAMPQARFWTEFGQGEGYKRLQAALSPEQATAMDNLLAVMEAASRAIYTGSDTAAKESAKELVNQTGLPGGLQLVMTPWRIPGALADVTSRQLSNANVRKLAEVMTNDGSVAMLNDIAIGKGVGAFNERNMIIVANAIKNASSVGAGMMPGGMSGAPPAENSDEQEPAQAMPQGVINPFNM